MVRVGKGGQVRREHSNESTVVLKEAIVSRENYLRYAMTHLASKPISPCRQLRVTQDAMQN